MAIALAFLASCATRPAAGPGPTEVETAPSPPPDEAAAFAWSAAQGRAAIRGRIAFRDARGDAYGCARASVSLTPSAPASDRRIARLYGSTERAIAAVATVRARSEGQSSPPYGDFVRSARCDDQGRFRFDGLPSGLWFVVARGKAARPGAPDLVFMARVRTPDKGVVSLALR